VSVHYFHDTAYRKRDVDQARVATAQRRARRDRHVLFGFAFLAVILGLMLAGCSGVQIPDEFRTQVLVNVSSVAADLDAWSELTDADKRSIVEDFRLFALDTAKVIELDVPQDLR